jgi:hypothetical protein
LDAQIGGWQTQEGLRIGDPVSKVHELYPVLHKSTRTPGATLIESNGGPLGLLPFLEAVITRNGFVGGFTMYVGAAGE